MSTRPDVRAAGSWLRRFVLLERGRFGTPEAVARRRAGWPRWRRALRPIGAAAWWPLWLVSVVLGWPDWHAASPDYRVFGAAMLTILGACVLAAGIDDVRRWRLRRAAPGS